MSFGRKEGVVDKNDTFLHVDRMCVGLSAGFSSKRDPAWIQNGEIPGIASVYWGFDVLWGFRVGFSAFWLCFRGIYGKSIMLSLREASKRDNSTKVRQEMGT